MTQERILLIEDEPDIAEVLQYNLEKEGFSLTGQQTGKGAIELCRLERMLVIFQIRRKPCQPAERQLGCIAPTAVA